MNDDPKPPIFLCSLIASAAIAGCCALLLVRQDTLDDTSLKAVASQMSGSAGEMKQLMQLQRIYSNPPESEDPSRYPKGPGTPSASKRGPAKNAQ